MHGDLSILAIIGYEGSETPYRKNRHTQNICLVKKKSETASQKGAKQHRCSKHLPRRDNHEINERQDGEPNKERLRNCATAIPVKY
jgi:hypothetical protein